ncbi:MAG: hypothetical protein CME62_00920 [Halobacteriovoraceae bacterium]|nr:hypothetical protein [Halobacteriovoraceae bacterium]|tara:strand:- start:3257 stop:3868 length:612 start_codon:yes stop_codon:yes gene_type:complete
MIFFTKSFLFSCLFLSLNAFAFGLEKETIHFNSKIELSSQPSSIIEIGEAFSTKSAFYIGALVPNNTAQSFDQEDIFTSDATNGFDLQTNVSRVYLKSDYFFNGAFQQGFFVGGFLSYTEVRLEDEDRIIKDAIRGAGGGVQIGYLYRFKSLTLGASLLAQGFSYNTSYDTTEKYEDIAGLEENILLPHHDSATAAINFGYTF